MSHVTWLLLPLCQSIYRVITRMLVAQFQVLVVIKRVPGEWMNGDKSLKTQCESYVGNWWVAAVNRLKAVGVDVQWIELFNEPKCASCLMLQSMYL